MFKKVLLVCCTCCALLGCSTEEKIELEWITENAPIPKGLKDYALKSHDEHFYNLYNLKTAEDLKNLDFIKTLGKFDVLTVNPPYKLNNAGILNPNDKDISIGHHLNEFGEVCQ